MNNKDVLSTVPFQSCRFHLGTGKLAENIITHWLRGIRESNSAILAMFAERDKLPYRDLLPWSGEFAGKYLTGAYYIYKITFDEALKQECMDFCDELISYQDEDGYLGCYSKECHLTGAFSQNPSTSGATWDAWGHYHWMFALLLWYHETGRKEYFDAVKRAAALFLHLFYNPKTGNKLLSSIGSTEMNLSPVHIFALLYKETGETAYLDFAKHIVDDFNTEGSGDYIRTALSGLEFYQGPKPRWESMHCIIGIAEMYRATDDRLFLQAAEQIFRSILKTDIHNTGAFSTKEQAVGNPFSSGSIESCCVIAYNALGTEILKLTGDSKIADYLELSHYNACMGMWSPSGRWSTYDTPMNGVRLANTTSIQFQSRPGSPELNCCSVNAARSIGMIGEWAVMKRDDILTLNAYESADYETKDGVRIQVTGGYPFDNKVKITVDGYSGKLMLRIPGWSLRTHILCGNAEYTPQPGAYFPLPYASGEKITVTFDFDTRYLRGELEFEGMTSVFRGPILYGTDTSICGFSDMDSLPALSQAEINRTPITVDDNGGLLRLPCGVTLCDFAHLGSTGASYITWLSVKE